MPTEEVFFDELQEWSERKLKIISSYLTVFVTILQDTYYIDAFAGKGMYRGGEKGSPLRAAEIAKSERYLNKLKCIFIEKNPTNFNDLKNNLSDYQDIANCYKGSFSDKVDAVLKEIYGVPGLFFLDAFGIKGADWLSIEKVLSRLEKTDIWIRFDHITIRRLDGFFESDCEWSDSNLKNLSEHFGINDLCYLHEKLKGPTSEIRIKNAVALYKEQIKSVFGRDCFVGSYPIISLDGKNKYHLLFATKNNTGAIIANDIINKIEEKLPINKELHIEKKREKSSLQPSLFFSPPSLEDLNRTHINNLIPYLQEIISTGDITVKQLNYRLIENYEDLFGNFRSTHLTKALKILQTNHKIEMSGAPSNKNTTISKKS